MAYAYLLTPQTTSGLRPPTWRLFAINTTTGAAYEQNGGFDNVAMAKSRRDRLAAAQADPAAEPDFVRLWLDATIVDEQQTPTAA